jgi:hypothetical protein
MLLCGWLVSTIESRSDGAVFLASLCNPIFALQSLDDYQSLSGSILSVVALVVLGVRSARAFNHLLTSWEVVDRK